MVGRDPQRPPGVGQGLARIAGVAPGGGAQHQDLDVVRPQAKRLVEVGNGPRPGQHGGVAETAIDPQIGIVGLELERPGLRVGRLVGLPGLDPGLAGLGPQFGPQARAIQAHVAGDRLELRRRLEVFAGLEHGDGDTVAGTQAAALGVPFLGHRQRLERLLRASFMHSV